MSEVNEEKLCTGYTTWHHEGNLCRCPNCQAFLPRDFPFETPFTCKKCGEVLTTKPDVDEARNISKYHGQICMKPDHLKTEEEKEKQTQWVETRKKEPRIRSKKVDKWAMGESFARRVWRDQAGQFITVNGERIPLDDKRIMLIHEGDLIQEVKT